MAKRIVDASVGSKRINDTSRTMGKVAGKRVAEALNAQLLAATKSTANYTFSMVAIKQELHARLRSAGGRPALKDATRRQKIPLTEAEWDKLQLLADELAKENVSTTAGQIASILLHRALQQIDEELTVA